MSASVIPSTFSVGSNSGPQSAEVRRGGAAAPSRRSSRLIARRTQSVQCSTHRPLQVEVICVERILPAGRKRLITIRDEAALMDAAKFLREPDVDLVVVCNADELMVGVISKTDIVRQFSQRRESDGATAASTVMTRTVVSFCPDDLLHNVWTTMKHRRLKNVPILDPEYRPIGVLNARDVLEALLEEAEHEEMLLRDYVMSIGHPRI